MLLQQRVIDRQRRSPMQTQCTPKLFEFASVEEHRVQAAFDGGDVTSNAGGLLLGAADRAKTASRSASSISLPTAPPPAACAPISCASGSRPWPTSCSAPSAGSAWRTPSLRPPPAEPCG